MSSARIQADANIKQGSRIVHPIYARYALKDGTNAEEFPKEVAKTSRNVNSVTLPVSTRLSNRLRNLDQIQVVPTSTEICGYYRQKLSTEILEDLPESRVDSACALREGMELQTMDVSTCNSSKQLSPKITKDNLTEKNKKSSIEQKRFYQRKLTGLTAIKFLPVGRLFKFLKPPLQRRNSCPVLSISEAKTEFTLPNKPNLGKESDISSSKIDTKDIKRENNKSCRLTKWTSHGELPQLEGKPHNSVENVGNANKATGSSFHTDGSNEISNTDLPLLIHDLSQQLSQNVECKTSENSSLQTSENISQKILSDKEIENKKTESTVVEKTVIIVSESESSSEINNTFRETKNTSGNVNVLQGVTISMNSSVSKFKTQKCIEWETNQENLITNKILNSQKQSQKSKLSNSVKVITTERDISFPGNQDKKVTTIDDAKQKRESLTALCTKHLNKTDEKINIDSEKKTSIKLQVCNPEINYSNSPIDHLLQNTRDENNALKDVDISNNNINEYTGRNKIHTSTDTFQINTCHPGTNDQNKIVNESHIVSEKIKASTIILNGKCSVENGYLDLEFGTALNHRTSCIQDEDANLRNSVITTNFINSGATTEISEKNLSNVHSFPNNSINFISHTNTTVDEAIKFQERVSKLQNDFFVNRYETINDIITNCNDDYVHKSLNQRDNSKPAVCSTVKVLAQEEYDSVKLKELRIHKPQLIGIVCNQTANKTAIQSNQQNRGQTSEIRISVLNDVRVQSDILDFGECSANNSTTDLQENDINECYNVKLDAPEEVIVAGFHDFCHTMLSLEESIEMQDTRTLVKNRKQLETSIEVNTTKTRKEVMGSAHSIKQQSEITNLTRSVTELHVSAQNYSTSQYSPEITENTSNKFEEDNQNNKLLDKMNIKDPDVIDAITVLDKSLMEASEQTPILFRESEMNTNATNIKQEASETKNISKIIREDKIQCDNLIEELMLEDSKRVSIDPASHPSSPGGRIAVTISNMSSQRFFDCELDQKVKLGKKELTYQQNVESHNARNDVINEVNYSSLKVNKLTKEEMKTFNRTSTNTNELSNFDEPDNETKRVSEMSSVKDDSLSLPASITSEDTNAGFTLQVSEENNPAYCIQDVVACNRTSPCSVDSGTSSHNQGYFVVVAIDFGTTYSGYAFSFTRDPDNIHMMKKWDGGDPGVFNQKTPTTLLLSPEGTFHAYGYSARDYYHDLDEEEAKGWLYFEKFKMTLHNNEHLSLDTKITAANGKSIPAVTVFSHALRYFKDHALQELSEQSATRILNEDVRWVVTVPAIWKQPAKQFMRAAAYEAGIASPDFPDQLLIALEPEAASIYCRRMKLHQLVPEETHFQRSSLHWQKDRDTESEAGSTISDKDLNFPSLNMQGNEKTFTVGTRYMVVDCGGGTVDITVHELLDKQGTLKELQKASGGPYGSIGVDMEFEKLLCDIFGENFMQQFKSKRPIGYVDLMIAFEARKRNANPYKTNSLNISLPYSFIEYYKQYKGSSVESAIKKSSHKNVKWSQGMLRLEPSAMEALFQKTVTEIKKHIESIVNQEDMNIDHIFLVGGFAESLILQKEIKEAFSSKLKVVIPQGVSLAILKGAVLFGLDPTTVNIRRLRMTYGVGVLHRFIHGIHPREKLVIKDGIQWCADVFDKFVVNGQSVGVGDVVVRCYTPAKDGQSCSVIHIYCSEKDNIYFITDPGVKRCATLILDLSDSRFIQGREIQTRMMFGDTEIKVSALDVTTGKCVKADIDFLNY